MEELKFSSENKALQYLADVTGKSIKIAGESKLASVISDAIGGERYLHIIDIILDGILLSDDVSDDQSYHVEEIDELVKKVTGKALSHFKKKPSFQKYSKVSGYKVGLEGYTELKEDLGVEVPKEYAKEIESFYDY